MTDLLTIILAAGDGTRMKSERPKLLHPVAGRPIIEHVVAAALDSGTTDLAVVVAPEREAVRNAIARLAPQAAFYEQAERLGTGHAAMMAKPSWDKAKGYVAVVYGDHPLLRADNFKGVFARLDAGYDAAVLGFEPHNPAGYGRLVTQGDRLLAIREDKDASDEERRIGLCNACILAFRAEVFQKLIGQLSNDNAQSEYYLTDLVELANHEDLKVTYAMAPEADVMGVNSQEQLAAAEAMFQQRLRKAAMANGATLIDPQSVFFAYDTEIGQGVTIEPNVFFGPGVKIADGATIHGFSHIAGATIGAGATVGPFARLRPGAELAASAKVGNFCEVKNAGIGEGAKVNHLSYIGDAEIGAGANIGAGTITCNYDGVNKHRTEIGPNVFVGSNSALVAPLAIGAGAYIASGSVITGDVEAEALAIGRARQTNKSGYAPRLKARAEAQKARKLKDKA